MTMTPIDFIMITRFHYTKEPVEFLSDLAANKDSI